MVATGEHALAHDASVLVALALLAATFLAARLGHPDRPRPRSRGRRGARALRRPDRLGGVVALADGAGWALHVGARSRRARRLPRDDRRRVPRPSSGSAGLVARLRDPDEASDHDAAPPHGRRRVRRGAGGDVVAGLTLAATLAGLALACGGASALNHVLDRDIDKLMGTRTESAPVAAGRIPPERALEFGLALSALSFVVLRAS